MSSNERIDALVSALRSGRSLEALAQEAGVSPRELELVQALLRLQNEERSSSNRRRALQVAAAVACFAGLGVVLGGTDAWAAGCAQTLPAPLVTFCPDDPALVSQVNGNFQQLATWLQQKTGPLGSNNVVVNGNLTVNGADGGFGTGTLTGNPSLAGNLVIDGGIYFGATTRQHLNLWGTGFGMGVQPNTEYFRTGGNFGFYLNGSHVDATLDPGPSGTTLLKILSTGETIARGQFQNGTSAPVLYDVSTERLVVEAGTSFIGSVVPINQTILTRLCADLDGCPFTLSMVNWDGANRVATRSGTLYMYEGGASTWRTELNGTDTDANDSDNAVHELSAWDCFLTDAESSTGTNNQRVDTMLGLGLLNCRGCNYSDVTTRCRVVFRD